MPVVDSITLVVPATAAEEVGAFSAPLNGAGRVGSGARASDCDCAVTRTVCEAVVTPSDEVVLAVSLLCTPRLLDSLAGLSCSICH